MCNAYFTSFPSSFPSTTPCNCNQLLNITITTDSLLLAGSATERVAFGVTSAAEGCVRIVQDFTSQIATMFSKEGERNIRITRPVINEELDEVVDVTLRQNAAEEEPTKETSTARRVGHTQGLERYTT